MKKKISHKWRYILGGFLVLLIGALVAARLYLNVWLTDYVNRVLANIPGYQGSIADIDIDLYRGAYRIHQLKIFKKVGHIPSPFIDIALIDFSLQWGALIHGRVVSDVELVKPILNFAISPTGATEQTGAEVDWSKPIRDLMPIDINVVTFSKGKLTYQDFSTKPQVNIYINDMNGELRNMRNVEDIKQPLPSTLVVRGGSIGGGKLEMKGKLNILKPVPDMDMQFKLENVNLPALTDYSDAYAAVDIREGNLNVYSEFTIKDNRIKGYIKPLATNVALIDLRKDANPIKLVWQALVATVVEVFTNHSKDQFATKIELEGTLDDVKTNTWSQIAGIVRNAFVGAFKNEFDRDVDFRSTPAKAEPKEQ